MKFGDSKFFYSKEASIYDKERWSTGMGQYMDRIQKEIVKSMLPEVSGKKILEIGAGTGRFSFLLAEMGAEVTALDISQEMLDVLQRKAKEANLSGKISVVRADASQKIPLSDNSFDFCIAINTLSHVKNSENLLKEVCRVLKPNGIFLANYPNLNSIYFLFGALVNLRKMSLWKKVFTKWYSLSEIKKIHEDNGLSITTIMGELYLPFKINNKSVLKLLALVDKSFRTSILRYVAPTIFVKAIRK